MVTCGHHTQVVTISVNYQGLSASVAPGEGSEHKRGNDGHCGGDCGDRVVGGSDGELDDGEMDPGSPDTV